MRLAAFKVEMYRPVLDSGWIDIDDITVIVGKNESGKTALLKALHKFKPFKPETYSLDREWPRGHRKERSENVEVVRVRFTFSDEEAQQILKIFPGEDKPSGVEISKTYKGEFRYVFMPTDFPSQKTTNYVKSRLQNACSCTESASETLKTAVLNIKTQGTKLIDESSLSALNSKIAEYKNAIDTAVQQDNGQDKKDSERIKKEIDEVVKTADVGTLRKQIDDMVSKLIPTFIYMDDHKPFQGIAHLDQVKQRKNQSQLTDEDKTFLMILDMAGLDFEKEVARAGSTDKEQRMLDMSDASLSLTNLIAQHWSQRKYEVRFEADGNHVIAFVSDTVQPALVPLNERSKGFQWFFSFDMTFLCETGGTFKNAIILLDEPGLHLHAAAQRDLLKRLKEYAKGNQLIYTTHMPFMIDMERLDNIRICTENGELGTKISSDFYTADEHARFPLQAALGLSISQSLFVGPYNLVVEGITDFWLLSTMAAILRSEGQPTLDERIVITPSGGATKAAYVATMLQGQNLNVVILLDSDPEGHKVANNLIKQWIMKDRHVILLGKALGKEEATLEDIFTEEFYIQFVNQSYSSELGGKPLSLQEVQSYKQPLLIRRIDAAFRARGFQPNSDDWSFNKGRPTKLMLTELPKRKLADLPKEIVERFISLFNKINESMPGLKGSPVSGTTK